MAGDRLTRVLPLADVRRGDALRAGQKAAHLGDLLSAGFPVPDGFVIPAGAATGDEALALAVAEGLAALGDAGAAGAMAVRSSAAAEDRPDASFAGIYETVLDVSGAEAVAAAVRRCRRSATGGAIDGYRPGGAGAAGGGAPMAVLVQRLVRAECAGVAFTADPLTGERGQVLVAAARGLGDRLVAGGERGEHWIVDGAGAARPAAAGGEVIDRERAQEIAALARRVEAHLGAPQDLEWAFAGGRLFLLQARPMTALPPVVRWDPPRPGGWLRNFRLGEWLPEPVTPLFESWFLERCEAAFAAAHGPAAGFVPPPPRHVLVNGWYFHSPLGSGTAALFLRGLMVRPRASLALMRVDARPETADRLVAAPHTRHWREQLLPGYRALVARAERLVDGPPPPPAAVLRMIDEVADLLGAYLWSMAMVGGFAWKLEAALARFCKRHLASALPDGHQVLVVGLAPPAPQPPPHAVHSLDWYRPTAGELGSPARPAISAPPDRAAPLGAARAEAEARCRQALATAAPRRRRRFDLLLDLAQRYAVLREEQAGWLTLAWPVMRRALGALGRDLASRGRLATADDVFFITRPELDACLAGASPGPTAIVADRRRAWETSRRLTPPLVIGRLSPVLRHLFGDAVEAMRAPAAPLRPGALRGMPASPGRATGKVRLLRSPGEAERLQPGEVLVIATATPAWTPLFERAAALITDGGSIVAHSSLIAREYGLPVVVATGDATARLTEGQVVLVDGSRGTVEPL